MSRFKLWKQDPFGHALWIKKFIIRTLGSLTHRRYRGFNDLHIEGSEIIRSLPERGVLFISNHQTYFADVIAMYHVFNASLKGREDSLKNIGYVWQPKLNLYYVAASETMRSGILPKILAYVGAVKVSRTWREKGKEIHREVNPDDIKNIGIALQDGWLITFEATKVVDSNMVVKKKGIQQTMRIKAPLEIDYERESVEEIIEKVAFAIEQHPTFIKSKEQE